MFTVGLRTNQKWNKEVENTIFRLKAVERMVESIQLGNLNKNFNFHLIQILVVTEKENTIAGVIIEIS